ncbi:hypothetical protein U6G28_08965 [Actinomycetaceae bacterium MB13-C1-2]|nr:hypothetical protein U6G28_08965 [Actinomycetaceae bacterium MB13-C1-2]
MIEQSLFDLPLAEYKPKEKEAAPVDEEALQDLAFLYTATERGNSTGIRFAASREDARKWCDSPQSRGYLHGTRWAYFFTSAWNYVRHYRGDADTYKGYGYQLDIRGERDNGTWDERIESTGCKIVRLEELPDLLEPLGVRVFHDPIALYKEARAA